MLLLHFRRDLGAKHFSGWLLALYRCGGYLYEAIGILNPSADTPLTYEAVSYVVAPFSTLSSFLVQLTAPDLTYTLIRPLLEKYCRVQRDGNMSVVFCFLLNRVHFIRDRNLATSAISKSRATLCEIMASRALRDYGNSMLDLTLALTTTWPVYSGADPAIIARAREERDDDLEDRVGW